MTDDGMDDLLENIEDTQEDFDDDHKLYGMTPDGMMKYYGGSAENQAIGFSCLMESIAHELGHRYGLDHAPCGGAEDTDGDFVPPSGRVGEVGVDVVGQVAFAPGTSDFMSYCYEAESVQWRWLRGTMDKRIPLEQALQCVSIGVHTAQ